MSFNNLIKESILEQGDILIVDIKNTFCKNCGWTKQQYEYLCIFLNYYYDTSLNNYNKQYIDVFYLTGPYKYIKNSLHIGLFKKYEKENK